MNLLVCQILQKYQEIKHMMRETWIKLVTLEKSVETLRCTKMPLIALVPYTGFEMGIKLVCSFKYMRVETKYFFQQKPGYLLYIHIFILIVQ